MIVTKNISQFPAANAVAGNEQIPFWQNGTTVQATIANLLKNAALLYNQYNFANLPSNPPDGAIAYVYDIYRGIYRGIGGNWIHDKRNNLDPRDYGAKGNFNINTFTGADDTAAFQKCYTDAIALNSGITIPSVYPNSFQITGPIVLTPPIGQTQARLNTYAEGSYTNIVYNGPNNTSIFQITGLTDQKWENVRVYVPTANNITVWDFIPTASIGGGEKGLFINLKGNFGSGGNNICFRSNVVSNNSDWAYYLFESCRSIGITPNNGDIGWQVYGQNALPWTFLNCGSDTVWCNYLGGSIVDSVASTIGLSDTTINISFSTYQFILGQVILIDSEQMLVTGKPTQTTLTVTRAYNNTSAATHSTGALVTQLPDQNQQGGTDVTWLGGGCHGNMIDYWFNSSGSYTINGGRYEVGQRYVNLGKGGTTANISLNVIGPSLNGYTAPTDGAIFNINNAATVYVEGLWTKGNVPFGASMFKLNAGAVSPTFNSLTVVGGAILATDPFYTVINTQSNVTWKINIKDVGLVASGTNRSAAYASERALTTTPQTLTYSTSITPNPRMGGLMTINVTNTTAFTINNPVSNNLVAGDLLAFVINNNSGGIMGAITWGNKYNIFTPFTNPTAGNTATITFQYDGNLFQELSCPTPAVISPVNLGSSNTFLVGPQIMTPGADGNIALVAKGNSPSQTASVFQLQTSTGALSAGFSQNGEIGLGQDFASGIPISITSTPTITSGPSRCININYTANPASSSSANYITINTQVNSPATQSLTGGSGLVGGQFASAHGGTGLVSNMRGSVNQVTLSNLTVSNVTTLATSAIGTQSLATNASTGFVNTAKSVSGTTTLQGTNGAIGTAIGGDFSIVNSSTSGVITTAAGLRVIPPSSATGTITTNHGLYIQNQGLSTITTSYGLRLDAQSGSTTNYSIFSSGGQNFFATGSDNVVGIIVKGNSGTQSADLVQHQDNNSNLLVRTTAKGNLVVGYQALATTATDGFLYIASGSGTPTGVPTTFTGTVPLYYDTSGNKLYIYNSGWKGVSLT